MRTKTLLLTAAVGAAGVATSMAQVFSVNAVGYVNVAVKPGFALIANPLKATDSKISALLPNVPEGTTIYKYTGTGYDGNTFDFGAWGNPNMTLEPGEGFFIRNPGTANLTVTFVGEVLQGNLENQVPAGFSIRASKVPQAGTLDGDLKFPAGDGDTVYKFNQDTQKYDGYSFDFGTWSGPGGSTAAPSVGVGESVFVNKVAAANWTRTFSVNP